MSSVEQVILLGNTWADAPKIVDSTNEEICAFRIEGRPDETVAVGIGDEALVWLTPARAEQLIAQIQRAMGAGGDRS